MSRAVEKCQECLRVAASKGYPGHYEVGYPINGLNNIQDAFIFHAGTKFDQEGNVLTSGGRVLSVVATAKATKKHGKKLTRKWKKSRSPVCFTEKTSLSASIERSICAHFYVVLY